MAKSRKGLTWRDLRIGLMLALPFVGLAAFSSLEIRQYGHYWTISRYYIRLYCVGIISSGLALAAIAVPKVIADLPDSERLRAWAGFLVGAGYAVSGGILEWYMLARRDYQHPTREPFKVMVLLLVAWAVLVLASIYALILEHRAGKRESSSPEEVQP